MSKSDDKIVWARDPETGYKAYYTRIQVPESIMKDWHKDLVAHCEDPFGRVGVYPITEDGYIDYENPIKLITDVEDQEDEEKEVSHT